MSKETGFAAWLDSRMPTLKREWNRHMAEYYAPKNFNFWYFFGSLAFLILLVLKYLLPLLLGYQIMYLPDTYLLKVKPFP